MEVVQVSKWLNTVKVLEDVHEEFSRQLPWGRKRFLTEHREELAAYNHASEQLRKLGISPEVDLDKIEAMIEQQDDRISDLKQRSRSLDQRIAKLKIAQDEITRRDISVAREEREKGR